ncbi:Hypothetical protein PBC10988_7120 [Planctomycetales bacterium 10988]|nr:Hypothetical protein PBC10988_7120 [Planctomycetales bacterium 10988]
MFKKLRILILGLGSIGSRHLRNLKQLGVDTIGIVRRSHNNPFFSNPEEVNIYTSLEDALSDTWDLAIVCTPTSDHLAQAEILMKAGLPFLMEKPLASTFQEAKRFDSLNKIKSVPWGMLYCLRYHPAYQKCLRSLNQNLIGKIVTARFWFETDVRTWHPWEDYRSSYAVRSELGGGILPTLDHEIDYLFALWGEAQKISGIQGKSGILEADVCDWTSIAFQFPHPVQLQMSYASPAFSRGFSILGTEGQLTFDWKTNQLLLTTYDSQTKGVDEQVLWQQPEFDVNTMYLAMMEDCLQTFIETRTFPIASETGLQTLEVCEQVIEV